MKLKAVNRFSRFFPEAFFDGKNAITPGIPEKSGVRRTLSDALKRLEK